MTTIYVVTEGDYSDYHIVAVFTNKRKAERFLKQYNDIQTSSFRGHIAQIEEYEANNARSMAGKGFYWISVWMWKDGEVDHVAFGSGAVELLKPKRMYLTVKARSREHAIKIANERRLQLIATNKWPEK